MEYTAEIFVKFLSKVNSFDKEVQAIFAKADKSLAARALEDKIAWESICSKPTQLTKTYISHNSKIFSNSKGKIDDVCAKNIDDQKEKFNRLQKCKEILFLVGSIEKSIADKEMYDSNKLTQQHAIAITVDDLISGKIDFIEWVRKIDLAVEEGKKKNIASLCSQFYCICRYAEKVLSQEVSSLRKGIVSNTNSVHAEYNVIDAEAYQKLKDDWDSIMSQFDKMSIEVSNHKNTQKQETQRVESNSVMERNNQLKHLCERFCSEFPPEQFVDEYIRLCSLEPSYDHYECVKEMPENIQLSTLECDVTGWGLSEFTKEFLMKHYYYMFNGNKMYIPHCVQFGPEFNYLFKFNGNGRQKVVSDACEMGMRLFMMLPPGKVNFTFIDPISLGESFATFTRLVNIDDRTSEVINGKIWSSPSDIEDKLRIMTDHISNITQRCLQGKYENIFEYNKAAEQNAEAYQIIMLMDFPAGLSDNSLRLLEQISISGPKCGVFAIIYRNESQYSKISERSHPLVDNIENGFQIFNYSNDAKTITYNKGSFKDQRLEWKGIDMPSAERMERIIDTLKTGIKNAEKIVVSFDKIIPPKNEWFKGDCSSELSIPIGVHGANNIQNLTFGIGGGHHALVAGQTGAGKSSLLHTIIMSALIKYPADQLQVFLVDFKRGVEFKIYANYSLENFRVIAIESEREFGCSVLEYLDKEQSRRADKFKRLNVDNVEDYRERSHETLPRIMVIIDEFHVLFSKDTTDSSSKASAAYLEQIIRQGRAFGIHIILASQTMSNIGGINYGVWGQVGVRIALKCPKSDAKFVLGNDNDGVDLLSADNPGQAVYNSDSGNVIANTVFRVAYIDQDEQDTYLKYIAANEPKFGYPETRVMLSNVEDNIYNPLQKFARGEKVSFAENSILVGEPLKLVNNMRMTFKAKHGSNMLVIGNDEQRARTFFTFAVLSLTLHKLYVNNYKTPSKKSIYFFDYAPLEDFYEKDILLELAQMLPDYIRYIPFDEADEAMKELYQDFTHREKGEAPKDDTYMLVYGLQRARNLRSSDVYKKNIRFDDFDEFGETAREQLSVKPYDMFLNLIQKGATVGINALIWEDNFKLFMNSYADMLPNFDMRVAFTMPDDDSINFIEEVDGSKIGENGAIYNYNGNQKFRPYKKPDLDWLTKICKRINAFR